MGLLDKSIKGRFYRIPPMKIDRQGVEAWVNERLINIQRFSFAPINIDRGEIQSCGWVDPLNILNSNIADHERIIFGDMVDSYVYLAARIDQIKIDKRIYKARLAKAIRAKCREIGAAQLSREQLIAIDGGIRLEMAKQAAPSTQIIEWLWNPAAGLMWIGATGGKAETVISDLLASTFPDDFDLSMCAPFCPATGALAAGVSEQDIIEALPTPFSSIAA